MDHNDGFLQRTECFKSGTRFDNGIRCIQTGMGSSLQRYLHRRSLVPLRASGTYQLPRIDGSSFRSQGFLQQQEGRPHSFEIGQPNGSSIHKPHGRHSFLSAKQPCYRAVEVVPGTLTNPVSRTPARGGQLCGGCRVSDDSVLSGVAASQGCVLEPDTGCVSVRCRPVCNASELPTSSVCQLEVRSLCDRDRCASNHMDQMERLCFSPLCTDQQSAEESTRGEVINPPHSSSLGISTVVPSSVVSVSELPHSSSSTSQPPSGPVWPTSPPVIGRSALASRMDTIRGGYTAAGISEEAAQLLLSGWSKGTNTTYQSAWNKWVSWCISREIDPLSCPVQPFLDFLAGLHAEGLKYRTINTIRSAVSMTHNQIEGIPLDQHPWVS